MKYEIFETMPNDFHPKVEISGCYLWCKEKILLLNRDLSRPQGNTWGVAAGKIETNETPLQAVIREVREEVGLNLDGDDLIYIGKLFCRLPHMDYIFYMFSKSFLKIPIIELNISEHSDYKWVTFDEARKLPLIAGGIEALDYFINSLFKA